LRRLVKLINIQKFDLLWIEYELFPWFPAIFERIISNTGVPYIVDYDDAIYHNYDTNGNLFVRLLFKNKIEAVMKQAALVSVGNGYLYKRAKEAKSKRVAYLPSSVDITRYETIDNEKNKIFTIGWIGTPATVKYLEILLPVFLEWSKKNYFCLSIIGAKFYSLPNIIVNHKPWALESEVSNINEFDVGIMPLEDGPWERGKCGYKLIQYMACNKPVIASPVGVNKNIVDHGINGFLAKTNIEWLEALDILYSCPEKRIEMGMSGGRKVKECYSIQHTAPKILKLFKSVVNSSNYII